MEIIRSDRPWTRRPSAVITAGLGIALAGIILGGCYERVVEAEGTSSWNRSVYEPNDDPDTYVPVADEINSAFRGN